MTRSHMSEESNKKREEEKREEGYILRWRSSIPPPPVPNTNFASFLLDTIVHHGEKKALLDVTTNKHYTYGDVYAMVPRVCANLAAAGVGAGDAVLILSPLHIDLPIAMLAIQLLQATCVPVNPILSPEEVMHGVRLSQARWALVEESVLELVENVIASLPPHTMRQVWALGSSAKYPSFSELMRTAKHNGPLIQEKKNQTGILAGEQKHKITSFNSSKTAAILYFSSGTTGLPKGVMLSHRSLLTVCMQNKYLLQLARKDTGRPMEVNNVLLVLPLYHLFANLVCIRAMNAGDCIVLMTKFHLPAFLDAIQTFKITQAPIVPHIANYIAQSPLLKQYDISSLMKISCGSAPLPSSTMQELQKKTRCEVLVGYGLTEICCAVAANNPSIGCKVGSVGHIMPYVELKIVGQEGSKGLPPGEEGEVWVRGPGLMMGYARPPGAPPNSPQPKEKDWLATGDLGRCDHEGFLFLTDRIKDVMKVKGYQVSPRELEEVLQEMDGVGEVAVIGVPSTRLGEAPRAYVVPYSGKVAPSPKEMKNYVAGRLAPYKHLAGGVEVVDVLPKNALGKVLKRQLRDSYINTKKNVAEKATHLSSKL